MSVDTLLTSIPPMLVYVVVGVVVGVESLGIPLPGEVVLVGASLLTTGPYAFLSVHGVAIAAVTGAVVGDSIGYYIGHRFGDRLFSWLERRFPGHVNADTIAYAEHVFHKYGVWAVFFGRFVALLRIFAGPLAGSLRMHYPRFLAANVAGAIAWAAGTAYGVHVVGKVVEEWMKDFSYVGLIVAVVTGIVFATVLRHRVRANVEAFAAERRRAGTADA